MKLRSIVLLISILLFSFSWTYADYREERPLQLQMSIGGGGIGSIGYGPGVGGHVGYQITKLIYLGATSHAIFRDREDFDDESYGRDNKNKEYHKNEVYGQEGAEKQEKNVSSRHLVEMRFAPWDFGLYFSAGVLYNGYDKTNVTYEKQLRLIGDNAYTTALEATVEHEEWLGPAAGIGYNHVFENGISLGIGANFGLTHPQTPEVEVKALDSDETVAEADLEDWKDKIEHNEKRFPHMFSMSIGYNF